MAKMVEVSSAGQRDSTLKALKHHAAIICARGRELDYLFSKSFANDVETLKQLIAKARLENPRLVTKALSACSFPIESFDANQLRRALRRKWFVRHGLIVGLCLMILASCLEIASEGQLPFEVDVPFVDPSSMTIVLWLSTVLAFVNIAMVLDHCGEPRSDGQLQRYVEECSRYTQAVYEVALHLSDDSKPGKPANANS